MIGVELVLGALTGFFTNDMAIRQLFNKNGIVVREREQFTDLIVRVLQEQIISEDVVNELKNDPVIVTYFERLVREFLTEELPYHLSDYTLQDFDVDNQVRAAVQARCQMIDDLNFDAEYIVALLSSVIDSEEFGEAFAISMKNLSSFRLSQLGTKEIYAQLTQSYRHMNATEWQSYVDSLEKNILKRIAVRWSQLDQAVLVGDVIRMDGVVLVDTMETLVQSVVRSEDGWIVELLKSPALQEYLYLLMERLLPELMGMQLPAALQVIEPILVEDRARLEQMVLESVQESVSSDSMIGDMISKYLLSFFELREDEDDWLTTLLKKLEDDQKLETFCRKTTNLFINEVLSRIDAWQQGDEAAFEEMKRWYESVRPRLIQLVDRELNQSLRDSVLGQRLFQIGIRLLMVFLRKQENPDRLLVSFDQFVYRFMEKTFGEFVALESKQEILLQNFRSYWKNQGTTWILESGMLSSMNHTAAQRLGDGGIRTLFETPLARLLCKSEELIPYSRVAEQIREWVFGYLQEFLGTMTHQQLDKLSHEEIRTLVIEMLGKEMRPLSYLGAAVGAVAGTATGVAMQLTGTAGTPETIEAAAGVTAARAAMYGAVGYGTNVMAIKGLFWPYEKTLGFQGLMSKNQVRLANKLKDLTSSYVINDSIWQEQVANLAEVYDTSHERILVQGLHVLNSHREDRLKPALLHFMHHDLGKLVYSQLQIQSLFADVVPMIVEKISTETWSKQMDQWLIDHHIYRRVIGEVLRQKTFYQSIGQSALQHVKNIDAISWMTMLQYLPSTMKLVEEQYYYENLWKRIKHIYLAIPSFMLKHVDAIAAEVSDAICARLPFTLQLGYKLAGGQRYVTAALITFISKKLPLYLAEHQDDFGKAFVDWSMQSIAGKYVAECGLNFSLAEGRGIEEAVNKLELTHVFAALKKWETKIDGISDERVAAVLSCFGIDTAHSVDFLTKQLSEGSLGRLLRQLDLYQLYGRVEPVVAVTLSEFMNEVSFVQLLGTNEETLWLKINQAMNVNFDEKQAIIDMLHVMLTQIEPALKAYAVQEGRTFIELADVPDFTYERICALSPEALEILVREMAQPYFTHVERMGLWGAVVSLPATMASMMLM